MVRVVLAACLWAQLLSNLAGQDDPFAETSPDVIGSGPGIASRTPTNPMVLIRDPVTGEYRDANDDGVVDEAEQALAETERRHLAQCLGTLRGGANNRPEVLDAARQAVEKYLLAMFDLDLADRKKELAAVEQQVQQLSQQLAERQRNRLELVKLRMLLLQQEFSGVAFPEGWQQLSELTQKGLEIKTNSIGMQLVKIPAGGPFTLPEDAPDTMVGGRSVVTTDVASFFLGQHEVTQGQWKKVMGTEPWKDHADVPVGNDFPAVLVSHEDVIAFCRKLSDQESQTYRLPTLTEWFYAYQARPISAHDQPSPGARYGMVGRYGDMGPGGMPGMGGIPGGLGPVIDESMLSEHAWWRGNTEGAQEAHLHTVGLKRPNAWGLYDMPGNVREICDVVQAPRLSAARPTVYRAYAGGSWKDEADHCGFAFENDTVASPTTKQAWIGFRVVLEPKRAFDSAEPTDDSKLSPPPLPQLQ